MHWFEISTEKLVASSKKSKFKDKLIEALNYKYGNYDHENDLRYHFIEEFKKKFLEILCEKETEKKVIICGANDGKEIEYIRYDELYAVDLCSEALTKLRQKFPSVITLQEDVALLPCKDREFDLYISLRTIHSRYVNLYSTLEEASRITSDNGRIIFSIANGYFIEGGIVSGLYDVRTKLMDAKLPYKLSKQIRDFFEKKGCLVNIEEITSEIFIIIQKV